MSMCSSQGDEGEADAKVTADSIYGDGDALEAEGAVLIAQPHGSASTISPGGEDTNILSVLNTADVLSSLSGRNSQTGSYTTALV